jgi:hypothetical protein
MAFTPTLWMENDVISAVQLNRMEQGIEDAHAGAIDAGAINTTELADGAVTTPKLANGAVTDVKTNLTEAAIPNLPASRITSGTFPTARIADSAITTAKINNGAVNSDKLANSAVIEAKIASSAVATAKIANGAVTSAKLATGSNERDWVLARTAAASAGVVGTYAFLRSSGGGTAGFGDTYAGSTLRESNSSAHTIGTGLSGTWRCMGGMNSNTATLWLRIA